MMKFRMNSLFTSAGIAVSLSGLMSVALAASTVTDIDFKTVGNTSQIEINADGPVTYETQENSQDKQVVLELKGAQLGTRAKRKLDTSSFNSKVSLVSPYQVEGKDDTARLVIQLKEMTSADVTQEGNKIRISIPNDGAVSQTEDVINPPIAEAKAPVAEAPAPEEKEKTNLDTFVESSQSKRFTGKPITLQVRDTDLSDVLRLIGEASGFNIVVGDGVGGKITLSLVDVPWDQALDVILNTKRLGAERKNNILRIMTLANMTTEKEELLRAQEATSRSAPRITRVFPISYADAPSLQGILLNFGNKGTGTASVAGGAAAAPTTVASTTNVQIDSRTNSLIVQDIPENIERMRKLIQLLDTPTPQVMIEAKIVEATEQFAKTMSGSLAFGSFSSSSGLASFNGGNPVDPLVGNPGVFANGAAVVSSSANSGTFGISPTLGFLPGSTRLNAVLNVGENESQVKVITAPKAVVVNKKTAKLVQGTPVLIPTTSTVAGVGQVNIQTVQNANISLDVTPTVTNSGSVLLTLDISRDVPTPGTATSPSLVAPRNIKSEVLVESGNTLVLGGLYTLQSNNSSGGFPFLRKIPILGVLFGSETESTTRSELFIFVTPRIINEKDAAAIAAGPSS